MSLTHYMIRSLHDGAITLVDARSNRSFARHTHTDFGIGLITHGAQRSWSGRGAVEAAAGDLITVNPGEVHDGTPVGEGRSWSMLYIATGFVGEFIGDLTDGQLAHRELHHPVIADRSLSRLFVRARTVAAHPGVDDSNEPLLALLGRLFGPSPAPAGSGAASMLRIREMIDDDPAAPHSLHSLARHSGQSRFQTLRAFARLTGLTPHAYVIQRRLELARRLVGAGTPLAQAAVEAGFADQSHMHRAFVARYGYTPGQYGSARLARAARSFKNGNGPRR